MSDKADHRWTLMRAAVLSINDAALGVGASATLGDVTITAARDMRVDGKLVGTLAVASATIALSSSARTFDVEVVREPRRQLEAALETFVRLLAVDCRGRHRVASPGQCLGLHHEDWAKVAHLAQLPVKGLKLGSRMAMTGSAGILSQVKIDVLMDREDGLALVAEALNARTATGRYLHLVRLFERAFGMRFGRLVKPLDNFLSGSPHIFTRTELQQWVQARGPSIHADRRDAIYLEADLRPFVDRMTEAAYDVLLNKRTWRDANVARRDIWRPPTGSAGSGADMFLTQGMEAQFRFHVVDYFGSYSALLAGSTQSFLPSGAWITQVEDSFQFRLVSTEAEEA
jgi:hypothetical protein